MPLKCNSSYWKRGLALVIVIVAAITFTLSRVPYSSSYHTVDSGSYWTNVIKNQVGNYVEDISSGEAYPSCSADSQNDDSFGKVDFDINGSDVMVFLHMQKTGGTDFGHNLVENIHLTKECEVVPRTKRRSCLRPNSDVEFWLFSRYSTGWKCGLHAGWTELQECVAQKMDERERKKKKRTYFYITFLRHPIKRFLSEWKHVERGATWKNAKFSCNHALNQIPLCFQGDDWSGVSLEEFMSCRYNMGVNRQTRMLADLRLVNCYEKWMDENISSSRIEEIENQMLESAKKNLQDMAFFGILEEQRRSQQLFEFAFPFTFKKDFPQRNFSKSADVAPSDKEMDALLELNHLDVMLYDYAATLFNQRFERLKGCFGERDE